MLFILSRNLCQRNIQRSATNNLVVRPIRNRCCAWQHKNLVSQSTVNCRKLQCLLLQKCYFRTTQSLYIPPFVAMILRPALRIGAFLMGRSIKKWWAHKSDKEKEEYKRWVKDRSNIILGENMNSK